VDNNGTKYDYNLALQTPAALCVYTYSGKPFAVRTAHLPGRIQGWWFDPVSGGKSCMGPVESADHVVFTPPNRRMGQNDWVLILETKEEGPAE